MKRFSFLLFGLVLSIALVACDEDDAPSEPSNDNSPNQEENNNEVENNDEGAEDEPEESGNLGIGDTAEIDGTKMTIKNVSITDERNEFDESDPNMVIKIEYEIENTSDDEIPVGMDLEVYDGTGNKMESYPLDNTMGSLQPGKKMQGTEHFGIEEGPIEIYFQPAISFSDPAIFEVDVE